MTDKYLYDFPYEPYSQQTKLMTEIFHTIDNRQIGIFESPTGTGKSLSVLCSSLNWILENESREIAELLERKSELKTAEIESQTESIDWINAFDKKRKLNEKSAERIDELERKKIMREEIDRIKSNKSNLGEAKGTKKKNYLEREEKGDKEDERDEIESDFVVNYDSGESDSEEQRDRENSGSITKIIYASRTHSQLAQVLQELRKTEYANRIVACSLGSRINLCVNPRVSTLHSINLINDKCLDLQSRSRTRNTDENDEPVAKRSKQSGCPFKSSSSQIIEFSESIVRSPIDIESLHSAGIKAACCPFYGVKRALPKSHLVLTPYQNLLNPAARLSSQIELAGNVVVIDEAHNLPDTICAANSVELIGTDIARALSQLTTYFNRYLSRLSHVNLAHLRQLMTVLRSLDRFLRGQNQRKSMSCVDFVFAVGLDSVRIDRVLNYLNRSKLAFKLRGTILAMKNRSATDAEVVVNRKRSLFGGASHQTDENNSTEAVGNPLLVLNNFLAAVYHSLDARILVDGSRSLTFLVVDPGKYLTDIVQQCRSLIVIGGTMQPFAEFSERLFRSAECDPDRIHTFSCDHVINPKQQMRVYVLGSGLNSTPFRFTYENRLNEKLISDSGQSIERFLAISPNGIVVFFPSYGLMNSFIESWKSTGIYARMQKLKSIFVEPRQSTDSEQVMRSYSHMAESARGALLFAVIGAKMSEGINFNDKLARLVMVIGIPYPPIQDPILQEKRSFIESKYGSRASQAMYENLAMRAVNQSIGRAIRHKDDYAAIILLDNRYEEIVRLSRLPCKDKLGLPAWMMEAVSVYTSTNDVLLDLTSFFKEKQ